MRPADTRRIQRAHGSRPPASGTPTPAYVAEDARAAGDRALGHGPSGASPPPRRCGGRNRATRPSGSRRARASRPGRRGFRRRASGQRLLRGLRAPSPQDRSAWATPARGGGVDPTLPPSPGSVHPRATVRACEASPTGDRWGVLAISSAGGQLAGLCVRMQSCGVYGRSRVCKGSDGVGVA